MNYNRMTEKKKVQMIFCLNKSYWRVKLIKRLRINYSIILRYKLDYKNRYHKDKIIYKYILRNNIKIK